MASKKKRRRRRLSGRHMLTLGALSLLGVSGYELWIRLEDFWAWTQGIRHLSAVQRTSFVQNMLIIFETPSMRDLGYKMLFLCAAILFSLICLSRRNRAKGAWFLMVLDVAVGIGGSLLGVFGFHPSNWAQTLKLIPLVLILAGCMTNYIHRAILKRKYRARKRRRRERREQERREIPDQENREIPDQESRVIPDQENREIPDQESRVIPDQENREKEQVAT